MSFLTRSENMKNAWNPVLLILCFLVFFSPLARGSVHAWAKTLIQLIVLAGIIVLIVQKLFAGKKEIREGLGFPYGKVFLVVCPVLVLSGLSLFFSGHPVIARDGFFMLVIYLGVFVLGVHAAGTRKGQQMLVYTILCSAFFLAVIGLLEHFDLVFFPWWAYEEYPREGVFSLTGPYVNRNHMAGFLEMAVPLMAVLFLTRERSMEQIFMMAGGFFFLLVTHALTLSRGGWASVTGALLFITAILLVKKDFKKKKLLLSLLVTTLAVGLTVLVSIPASKRLNTLTTQKLADNLTGRIMCWKGTMALIQDNLLTGTGPGTFRAAYPKYQVPGGLFLRRFAHNDYLQFTADTGILFIPVMVWLLVLFYSTVFRNLKSRSRQNRAFSLGAGASVFAILIHSTTDFNLHIPANIICFILIAALIFGMENGPAQKIHRRSP